MNDSLNFWTYSDDIPDGAGFGQFSAYHICWLAVIIIISVAIGIYFVNLNEQRKDMILKIIGISLVFLIMLRIIVLSFGHHMSVYELPLHLCSLAGFLCFLHAFCKWDFLGQIIYSLCFPGTVFAIIFPDWSYYPALNFITFQGFLFHGGIVVYTILGLLGKRINPSVYKMWKAIAYLVIIVPIIYIFDRVNDVNYMFVLRPSPDSPLEWIYKVFGKLWYLPGYALLVMIVVTLMNVIYGVIHGFKRKYYNN